MRPKKNQLPKAPPVRTLYSKPVLVILLIVIVLLVRGTWGVYQKEQESRKNVAVVQSELSALKERQAVLHKETSKLATPEGVEAALREKYQVSKSGESVLVVVDKPLPPAAAPKEEGLFSKMWMKVGGVFKKGE